ncbi:hypothetical protein E4U55_005293 [Claviceps digitariae]|nr:hypothetical protein E4U55_005293 [Claviceps digitariae]
MSSYEDAYEDTHVHAVYEAIAPHFSATRHSPWPFVKRFLLAQPPSSIGLDIGCGNGKYLAVNPAVHILGCDRSASLVALANQQHGKVRDQQNKDTKTKDSKDNQNDYTKTKDSKDNQSNDTKEQDKDKDCHSAAAAALLTADSLALPFRPHSADFIICIAVIHHFSTPQRRRAAIQALLGCLRRGTGRALIYVWALEQASSRRGWNEGSEQDTLVPWVMKRKKDKKQTQQQTQQQTQTQTQKQMHKTDTTDQGGSQTDSEPQPEPDQEHKQEHEQTYQRYYHLYREGELEQDARHAGGEVCESGYERDNWWVIVKTRGEEDKEEEDDGAEGGGLCDA